MHPDRDFLLKLAQGFDPEAGSEEARALTLLSRERVNKPLVMVNSSISGVVAGARDTWSAIESYVAERSLDIELCESGSIGLSSEEPVVSIQMPGKTRLFFSKVKAESVHSLLDDIFHHVIPEQMLIGQLRREGQEAWPDVPFLDEIPFFSLQSRVVAGRLRCYRPFLLL